MGVEQHAGELFGDRHGLPEEIVCTREDEPRSDSVADPPARGPVPAAGLRARGIHSVPRPFAQRRVVLVQVHHRLADERSETGLLDGADDRLLVMDAPHIQDGRRPRADQLRDPRHGGGAHGGGRMSRFQGKDPETQPVEQFEILCESAEECLAEMDVGLDETGDGDVRAQVDDRSAESRECGQFSGRENRFDRGAPDHDPAAVQDPPLRIHRHDRPCADERTVHEVSGARRRSPGRWFPPRSTPVSREGGLHAGWSAGEPPA